MAPSHTMVDPAILFQEEMENLNWKRECARLRKVEELESLRKDIAQKEADLEAAWNREQELKDELVALGCVAKENAEQEAQR